MFRQITSCGLLKPNVKWERCRYKTHEAKAFCFILSFLQGILPRCYMSRVSRTLSPSWWCSSAARTTSGTLTSSPSWWRCCLSPTLLYSLVLSDSLKWWRTIRCLLNNWSPPSWSSTLVSYIYTVYRSCGERYTSILFQLKKTVSSGQMWNIPAPPASSMISSLYGTISAPSSRVCGKTLPTMEPSWRSSSEIAFDCHAYPIKKMTPLRLESVDQF